MPSVTLRWRCGYETTVPAGLLATTYEPSDPQVGEIINIRTSFADASPIDTDVLKKRWVQTIFNENEVNPFDYVDESKSIAPGWNPVHAFDAAGENIMDVETWVAGGEIETVRHTVNVVDPDTYAWQHHYFVDLNGDATGMPANSATTTQVLSLAAFLAINDSQNGVRMSFRSGSTHVITIADGSDLQLLTGNFRRYDTFGGTAQATIQVLSSAGFISADFVDQGTSSVNNRVILHNLNVLGGYNPLTGEFAEAELNMVSAGTGTLPRTSIVNCSGSGLHRGYQRPGSNPAQGGMFNCNFEDYQDYVASIGGDDGWGQRGNRMTTRLLAPRGDGKPQPTEQFDFGDHAAVRNNKPSRFYNAQTFFRVYIGWSNFAFDKAIQPSVRSHTNESADGTLTEVLWNDSVSRILLFTGHHTRDTSTQTSIARALVAGNTHTFATHGEALVETIGAGGAVIYSNVSYMPDLSFAQAGGGDNYLFVGFDDPGSSAAVQNEPVIVENNTVYSDANLRWNGAGEILALSQEDLSLFTATETNNIMSGDGHSSGSQYPQSAFARGDDFRAITGLAGDLSVASDVPISFDRVRNTTGFTNVGAHQSAGPDVSIAASTLASVTIGRLDGWSATNGQEGYGITDYTGLVENGGTAAQWEWILDGQPFDKTTDGDPDRDAFLTVIDLEAQTGVLELDLTIMNRSGIKTTVRSNALTIT